MWPNLLFSTFLERKKALMSLAIAKDLEHNRRVVLDNLFTGQRHVPGDQCLSLRRDFPNVNTEGSPWAVNHSLANSLDQSLLEKEFKWVQEVAKCQKNCQELVTAAVEAWWMPSRTECSVQWCFRFKGSVGHKSGQLMAQRKGNGRESCQFKSRGGSKPGVPQSKAPNSHCSPGVAQCCPLCPHLACVCVHYWCVWKMG